jgi:antitoxin ChpS
MVFDDIGISVILKYNLRSDMTYEGKLRKVGGSVMLAIPPAVLEELNLSAGTEVELAVKARKLVLGQRSPRRRYTLDELIKRTKPAALKRKDRAWTSGKAVGREII